MTEALAIGDIHLDKARLSGLFGERANALQLEPVAAALAGAAERGIPRAVLLGDVFDRPRPTVAGLTALLRTLLDADGRLEVHIITGNHDFEASGRPHSLSLVRSLCERGLLRTTSVHDEPTDLDWDGMPVRMCPWGHSDPGGAALCFGHFARPGSVRDNGRRAGDGDGDVAESSGDALWVSGHLHTAQKVGRTYFPGTTAQYSFGEEDGPKHVLRLRAASRRGKWRFKADSERVRRPFRLATKVISDDAEWHERLPGGSRVRWRVAHSPELRQPEGYLKDNPSVVECRPTGSGPRSIGSDLAQEMSSADGSELEYGLTDGLDRLLESWGMEKAQVARAYEIVGEGIESLGLGR